MVVSVQQSLRANKHRRMVQENQARFTWSNQRKNTQTNLQSTVTTDEQILELENEQESNIQLWCYKVNLSNLDKGEPGP